MGANHLVKHPTWGKRNSDRLNARDQQREIWAQYLIDGGDPSRVPSDYNDLLQQAGSPASYSDGRQSAEERQAWADYQRQQKQQPTGYAIGIVVSQDNSQQSIPDDRLLSWAKQHLGVDSLHALDAKLDQLGENADGLIAELFGLEQMHEPQEKPLGDRTIALSMAGRRGLVLRKEPYNHRRIADNHQFEHAATRMTYHI